MATETNIIGNYKIGERIGRGGMGVVYKGRHLQLPREVAIKSIVARDNRDLRRLKPRFEREAYVQSQLDHPGIVKIYDYIVTEQTYYIVMEYVQGRSLAQLLAREVCPLPITRALDLFEQILAAVAFAQSFVYQDQNNVAHRGIIHRDLKPANIIVTPDDRIKITDFGIVKLVGSENTDTFGAVYGSPQYVSPEQAEGKVVDQRSDIYSLGIILYEMIACTPPFADAEADAARTNVLRAHIERPPRPVSELNREVTPELEAVVMRALEKNPDGRYPNATEFLRAVRRARGRSTQDIIDYETSAPSSTSPPQLRSTPNALTTDELNRATTGRDARPDFITQRESYITQPIGYVACPACGAAAEAHETRCRHCQQELSASTATVNLSRRDSVVWPRRYARGLPFAVALGALALVSAVIFYARHRSVQSEQPRATTQNFVQPTLQATPAPESALVEVKPARVQVDSNFSGYSSAPLTDGEWDVRRITHMRYNKGNWSSDETPTPHWIELDFGRPITLAAVYLYWGFDHNRFTPSRRVELQTPDEHDAWRTISTLEPGQDYDRAAFAFAPVKTARARLLQPAQMGPTTRPFVMWLREVRTFSIADDKISSP